MIKYNKRRKGITIWAQKLKNIFLRFAQLFPHKSLRLICSCLPIKMCTRQTNSAPFLLPPGEKHGTELNPSDGSLHLTHFLNWSNFYEMRFFPFMSIMILKLNSTQNARTARLLKKNAFGYGGSLETCLMGANAFMSQKLDYVHMIELKFLPSPAVSQYNEGTVQTNSR